MKSSSENPDFLHVHHIGHQPYAPVAVEGLRLELVVDAAGLVPHVARIVAEPRDLYLGDHDLARVAPGAGNAARAVQAGRHANCPQCFTASSADNTIAVGCILQISMSG